MHLDGAAQGAQAGARASSCLWAVPLPLAWVAPAEGGASLRLPAGAWRQVIRPHLKAKGKSKGMPGGNKSNHSNYFRKGWLPGPNNAT